MNSVRVFVCVWEASTDLDDVIDCATILSGGCDWSDLVFSCCLLSLVDKIKDMLKHPIGELWN